MAVYTDVPDEEIAGFINAYDLGALRAFKGIAEGVENTNYLVQTDAGQFILTLYEKRVDPADLPFFLALLEHLAEHDIACPLPVHGRDGAALRELHGRPAALFTFLDGMWVRRPRVTHCRQLGAGLARLHQAGRSFEGERPNALSVPAWQDIFDGVAEQADSVLPGLKDLCGHELSHLAAHWPSGLPRGIIHADLFPDNVFFLGETLSGLIDFYFACTDVLAYDIAICINAWCFESDGSFNVTKARALSEGYSAIRPLEPAEIDALPILTRGASVRFLVTRLHDWINHPPGALVRPKDPIEYVTRLRFHQGVERATEYGLGPLDEGTQP
jgi:homoserine kinase type II